MGLGPKRNLGQRLDFIYCADFNVRHFGLVALNYILLEQYINNSKNGWLKVLLSYQRERQCFARLKQFWQF